MERKKKKLLASALSVGLLLSCIVQANAVGREGCYHEYSLLLLNVDSTYAQNDTVTHLKTYIDLYRCVKCHDQVRRPGHSIYENHELVYENLGESNDIHHYRISCNVCGFSQQF